VLLSTDGKMKLACTLSKAGSITIGEKCMVKTKGIYYTGLVENELRSDKASLHVTLTDNGPAFGASATGLYDERHETRRRNAGCQPPLFW